MYRYDKKLTYPINISKKDLRMAKLIITQFGGASGEAGAGMRYFSQKFTMPTKEGRNLLNAIATEEFGHEEMICAMVHQLVKDASIDEMEKAGLASLYADHGKGIYPTDASGNPFNALTFNSTGDALVDLMEDMAAEEKARITYEHLIALTDDPNVFKPLLFLRQREIVHFNRFKELYEKYKKGNIS